MQSGKSAGQKRKLLWSMRRAGLSFILATRALGWRRVMAPTAAFLSFHAVSPSGNYSLLLFTRTTRLIMAYRFKGSLTLFGSHSTAPLRSPRTDPR